MPRHRRFGCWLLLAIALLPAPWVAANAEDSSQPPTSPESRASEPADPLRPPAISTRHVPAIPPELAERLRQYQAVRGAAFRGWAPDGKGMLITTRFGETSQLHRVYQPEGRREQITFFDEPVDGGFLPQATDSAVLMSMSRGGDENGQISVLNPATGRAALLTDGESRNVIGAIRPDGKQVVIGSNRRNGRDTDLYLADPRQPGSMTMLMEVDGQFWSARDWSRDGTQLLLSRYVSANESYPAILQLPENRRELIPIPGGGPAAFGDMVFTPDASHVWLTTDLRGEFKELARVHLKTGEYTWHSADIPWDVTSLEVDPESGRLAFTVNEDGSDRLFLLHNGERTSVELPLGIVGGLEFSPDGRLLGFTLARPDAPADAYALELATGTLTRWTVSEVGGLNPQSFVTPSRIRYTTFDNREIPAYVFRPPTASAEHPVPVLINIHGGPESQYRPFFSGIDQFYVSELGCAVIHPNVRGSQGYGKTYLKLDDAALREDSVRDIGALLDWIARQPEFDARRVAVQGGSYGGYMVLASLVTQGDRLRAGVDIVGIAHFGTFLKNTAAYRRDLRRVEYGDERDAAIEALFERISPLNHAEKIRSALLVAHGKNDPRVPFTEAVQIADRVERAGRPVWTVFADNEGHGFAKKPNRDYLTAVIARFLGEQLELPLVQPLAGTWIMESYVDDGRADPEFKNARQTFTADRYEVRAGDRVIRRGRFVLRPDARPAEIDLLPAIGPYQGQRLTGIYELEGDRLHTCFPEPGQPRPTRFSSAANTGLSEVHYQRQP